jgi:hypothetical protein
MCTASPPDRLRSIDDDVEREVLAEPANKTAATAS